MTQKEVEQTLGLAGDHPVPKLLNRERKKELQGIRKSRGRKPAMSRHGNCYDNAVAENFFSILKTECVYRHKPASFAEATK